MACSTESKIYSLYIGSQFKNDYSMLLYTVDSTYVYSHRIFGEYGKYQIKGDTLFLNPKYIFTRNNAVPYDCMVSDYFGQEKKCVDRRVYIIGRDYIKDITLPYFFVNDSLARSFNEEIPLMKVKIKQTKKEKSILNSRKVLDRIW